MFEWTENKDTPLKFWYKNHRGEIAARSVKWPKIEYGKSSFHENKIGWYIIAFDLDKQQYRDFAMDQIQAQRA